MELNVIEHNNIHLILGPPGTGKTTKLLSILEKELTRVPPDKIGFVSFTRKAAHEAHERAGEKFGLEEREMPWFRTLHSFAYKCLTLSPEDVFDRDDCIALGKALGLFIGVNTSSRYDQDALIRSGGKGTEMLFIDNIARIKCQPLKEIWHEIATQNVSWIDMEHFSKSLLAYKDKHCVLDFTDMISEFVYTEDTYCPELDAIIIDEAQDLTRLQWLMVNRIAQFCDRVYIAGDDDQSIYMWSGADIQTFLNLNCATSEVLEHSYRLPRSIFNLANAITDKIKDRYIKPWGPRDDEGAVINVFHYEDVPLGEGEWLILARNKCFVEEAAQYCRDMGFHFSSNIVDSVDPDILTAIRLWERLRKGEKINGAQVRSVYEWMRVNKEIYKGYKKAPGIEDNQLMSLVELRHGHGLKTEAIWHEALGRIPSAKREHLIAVLKNKEKIDKPRIHISTIHSAKGGEADNVLLMLDLARRTHEGYREDEDPEHRVFYVGATRAKQNLYVFQPTTERSYNL